MESINNFIRKNTKNILVNNIEYNFNDTYKLYCEIKILFSRVIDEYHIKLFEYKDTDNGHTYLLLENDEINDSKLISFINSEIQERYIKEILGINFKIDDDMDKNLYILISTIGRAAEKISKMDKYSIGFETSVIDELNSFIRCMPDQGRCNKYNFFEEVELLTNSFANNHKDIQYITQKIKIEKERNMELILKLNFKSFEGLFYHYFLLELVYYGYIFHENEKIKILCPKCKKRYYVKGNMCSDCARKFANENRKLLAKCERRRNKIDKYLHDYNDVIPYKLKEKANDFIKYHNHSRKDLKQLEYIIFLIEKELKSN